MLLVLQRGADGHDNLATVDLATVPWAFPKAPRIPVGSVSPSTGQPVDAGDVEGVEPHASQLFTVYLLTNTGRLQSFRRELLIFI